jgi:hypothetical protein
VLDYLPNSELLVGICGDCGGYYPFVFVPFVTGETEKLEKDLSPHHMVCSRTRFFQDIAPTLNVAQRFPFVAERAIGGILFTPLVEESTTGDLQAD